MKNKKIKKLSKKIYDLVEKRRYSSELKEVSNFPKNFELLSSDYDEKLSQNFISFINNILKLEDINLEISENEIFIFVEVSRIKNKMKNSNSAGIPMTDDNLDVKINKSGFSIRRNYATTLYYKDAQMFENLYAKIIERNKEITKVRIQNIIDDVSKETNILRNTNLDKIMNSIEI